MRDVSWRRIGRTLLGVGAIVVGGSRLWAENEAAPDFEVDAQNRFIADTHLASHGTEISQDLTSVDFSAPLAGSAAYGLGIDLIAERFAFGFRNFNRFLPGRAAPLSGATGLTAQPTVELTTVRDWAFIASGQVETLGANGAHLDDSALVSGSLAVAFSHSKTLKIGLGVEVDQRLSASPLILPFPIIDWKISDRWSVLSDDGQTGRLVYHLRGPFSLFAALEFDSRDVRLSRSSSLPSGIMRYEALPVSLGMQWKVNPSCTAAIAAGRAFAQQYRFEDRQGGLLRASDTRGPPLGSLELDFHF